MRYVCLVYCAPEFFERMSPEEGKAFTRDNMEYDRGLARSGHFVSATPLQSADNAITVRVRDKRISTTDGPFAETKEHLCGFVLIEAADRDEAVRLASASPFAEQGCVEVRPVLDLS